MSPDLNQDLKRELINRGFSRRNFGRIATMMGAGAAALPFYNEPALAQLSRVDAPPDSVFINSNENPMGPCPEAREACANMIQYGGRYRFAEGDKVRNILAEQEGLPKDHVQIFPGSSAPLHQSVLAFCSPDKPFVAGDPGYEAGGRAAGYINAKTVWVPLLKDKGYAHDVRAMAAVPNAGLIYVCNPNNPTGTLTPKEDLEWLIANKPKGSVIMIDEAYTHISGAEFMSPVVGAGKDVIILRTFSKIYGMAGLRAGAAFARPDILQKINIFSHTSMLPITGMAAASASLMVKDLVPKRREIIANVRQDTFNFLEKKRFSYVPSVSNCFMVDVKRDPGPVISGLAKEKVVIGRVWKSWPTHVRVTVGTKEEMQKFQAAFLKVMA
ncbi:MAG TPA: pyridoxal phosphate-dependent aminotransferase [Verrucomicrobiae bacterium]|nr:pyridoxal phosphate-dependent aminotransferase [Verrucomicrobiae bacterium]